MNLIEVDCNQYDCIYNYRGDCGADYIIIDCTGNCECYKEMGEEK